MKTTKIGILTGGGDCAGLNPAIKWVVKTALDSRLERERGIKYKVFGIRNGWGGLVTPLTESSVLKQHVLPLTEGLVRTWDRFGGTNLGSSRTNPYQAYNDRSQIVKENILRLGLNAIVVLGGDDTLGVAARLTEEGVNIVGIPKTVDKDLLGTDYTLGFETAVNIITEEIDRLRTYAGSLQKIVVVETMGRTAGWLALEGGESAGAYIILIPEYDFDIDKINQLLMDGKRSGNRYNIIVVAEGAKPIGKQFFTTEEEADAFGHKMLGGVSNYLVEKITDGTGLSVRSIVLGYLQRGGVPCAFDRKMGRYFGIAAVDLLVNQDFGKMVGYRNGRITSVPIRDVVGNLNLVDVNKQYDTDRYNGRRSILNL